MRIHTGREDLYTFPASGSTAFTLELMGTSYCDGSYYIERSNVNSWVFEYVMGGRGTLRVADETCHPAEGQVYIVPAYSEHSYYSDASDPWTKIWFNVSGSLVSSLVSSYGIEGTMLVGMPELESIFVEAYDRCRKEPINAHRIAALAIHRMIAAIADDRPAAEVKQTQRLYDYLATHPAVPVSSKEMAAMMSLSVSQTIRLFKREWKMTPYQFHLQTRLAAAESLLKSTSKTIGQISEDLGFSDEYHLASIFKRKTGVAPGNCRYGQRDI